ncbi:MAG: hypothetical protein LQ342_004332 [Letrouitia transgressa]|nr:MAG: hypothetical protein LQ342_004332 [Letrouitia transgressa]
MDDFDDDVDFTAAVEAIERNTQPAPTVSAQTPAKIQQPTPQVLPSRTSGSSILVSPRQKGNPILNSVKSLPWEYSDIPADFVLGVTTCALFLSLKYHRLHPEYIYNRIQKLGHKYNLRVLLTMVDIQNHEEPLKELSKTSMVNNLTLILCWSAQEAGRYLELFKSYEHASPNSIRAHQSTSYKDKLIEFVTIPRSINQTDATSLISAFGSIKAAINARPEEVGMIPGWGEKKVQRWCGTVSEPFRMKKAAKRGVGLQRGESSMTLQKQGSLFVESTDPEISPEDDTNRNNTPSVALSVSGLGEGSTRAMPDIEKQLPLKRSAKEISTWQPGEDGEEALSLATAEETAAILKVDNGYKGKAQAPESALNAGMAAALAKLRKG